MSIKLMAAIFETEFRDLVDAEGNVTKASTAKFVAISLADHANDEGEAAYPSIDRLVKKTNLSRTCIINTLDALKYNGIISLNGSSRLGTNNYTVNPDCFMKIEGGKSRVLVNPVDPPQSTQLTPPVNPVDPNRTLTTNINIESRKKELAKTSIEAAIYADEELTEEAVSAVSMRDIAPKMFEAALKFSKPLPWWQGKDWTDFAEWVVEEYQRSKTSFGEYNIWRNTQYTKGGMTNSRIRGFINEFYDSWDMFKMATKPVAEEEKLRML